MKKGKKNITQIDADKDTEFIKWQAPEFEYRPKDVSWYWLSLMAAIALIALAVWQKNFLFAIFIALAWLVITSLANRFPTIWEFKIDEKGLSVFCRIKSPEITDSISMKNLRALIFIRPAKNIKNWC